MERIDRIQQEVEKTFNCKIKSNSRLSNTVDARVVFAKVALMFRIKNRDIAKRVNKTHCTISYYKKVRLNRELDNIALNIYEAVLTESETIKRLSRRVSEMDYLTENEKAYRRLTAAQRKVYDQRVSAILKMI